jgi:hypothetical protein
MTFELPRPQGAPVPAVDSEELSGHLAPELSRLEGRRRGQVRRCCCRAGVLLSRCIASLHYTHLPPHLHFTFQASAPVSMPLTGFLVRACAKANSLVVMAAGRDTSSWISGGRTAQGGAGLQGLSLFNTVVPRAMLALCLCGSNSSMSSEVTEQYLCQQCRH